MPREEQILINHRLYRPCAQAARQTLSCTKNVFTKKFEAKPFSHCWRTLPLIVRSLKTKRGRNSPQINPKLAKVQNVLPSPIYAILSVLSVIFFFWRVKPDSWLFKLYFISSQLIHNRSVMSQRAMRFDTRHYGYKRIT